MPPGASVRSGGWKEKQLILLLDRGAGVGERLTARGRRPFRELECWSDVKPQDSGRNEPEYAICGPRTRGGDGSGEDDAKEREKGPEGLSQAALESPWRSHAEERVQNDAEVGGRDVGMHLLPDLVFAPDPKPRQSACSLQMREAPLGVLRPQLLQASASLAS